MKASFYHYRMHEKTNIANDNPLEHMLQRSDALHERLDAVLGDVAFDDSPRGVAALGMCGVAMEHATAALRLPTTATSLIRLQFEAQTRAMWLLYAASDGAIDRRTTKPTFPFDGDFEFKPASRPSKHFEERH